MDKAPSSQKERRRLLSPNFWVQNWASSGKNCVIHSYWTWPSRNSWFTHSKWWFSIVMLVYQRVNKFQDRLWFSIVCCSLLWIGSKKLPCWDIHWNCTPQVSSKRQCNDGCWRLIRSCLAGQCPLGWTGRVTTGKRLQFANMAIEILDLPIKHIKHMVIFHCFCMFTRG